MASHPMRQGQMGEPLVRVEDLVVRRGPRTVLTVPALDVRRGESLALIGPNGAGKSTLLLALALLLPPSQGQVRFEGEAVTRSTDLTQLRRRMAVVFQEPLLVDQSVWDNVALGLRLRGLRGAEVERRVTPWLERLGIADLARRSARGLSGGEAQRTSLARAFALQPDLLLLDEPFAALDAPTRAGLVEQVGEIVRDMGLTTVMVTHDRDEALALGDRLAVLIGGRLAQVGPPDEVFSAPADEPVAQFVGVETILPGQVVGYADGVVEVRVGPHVVEAVAERPPRGPVLVCLRPEDITLLKPDPLVQTSARNRLVGQVERVRPVGAQTRVTVTCGVTLTALVTRRSVEALGLAPGVPVVAAFKANAVHLIERS